MFSSLIIQSRSKIPGEQSIYQLSVYEKHVLADVVYKL